jgi:hypothetical protein
MKQEKADRAANASSSNNPQAPTPLKMIPRTYFRSQTSKTKVLQRCCGTLVTFCRRLLQSRDHPGDKSQIQADEEE